MSPLRLEIVEGESAGRTFALSQPLEIGRDKSVEVVLEDAEVSRRHVRLTPSGGGVIVEDLGSSNGSYVNDQPLDAPREAGPGDRLRVGLTVFEIQRADPQDRKVSGVIPVPPITALEHEVLEPVGEPDLPTPAPEPQAPGFRVPETEPAYVPGGGGGSLPGGPGPVGGGASGHDVEAGEQYQRVAGLRDPRVKPKTRVAAFALLSVAALALLIYFGLAS